MSKPKVLVTGATGLLGANIVCQLNKQNYSVRILTRKNSSLIGIKDCQFEHFIGDITDVNSVKKAVQNCDIIIHAAALTAISNAPWKDFYKINVLATKLLIQQAKKANVKKFLYISTANCFTNGSKFNPGTENSDFMPWLKKSYYAYSKYLAQKLVLQEATENFHTIILAPTFLIGPRDSKPSSGRLILYALKNKIIFYPKGGKSFIDAELAASAIVNAIEKGQNKQTYLLAGKNLSYYEFFKTIISVTKKKSILLPLPEPILAATSNLLTAMEKLGFHTNFNNTNRKLLTLDNYFSAKKAEQHLNLQKTDVSAAIKKFLSWYEKNIN